jgi:hypothetical protein
VQLYKNKKMKRKLKKKNTPIVELLIDDEYQEFAIDAISLVTTPAIEQDFVYFKKKEYNMTFAKTDDEKRLLISPALIPYKQIYRYDADTDTDYYVYFSADTVKRASELYLTHNNHHKATYEHESELKGVTTVESWVKVADEDKSNHYGYDLPIGTWFVSMKIDNDDVWNEIKDGNTIKGLSIEGVFVDKMEKMSQKTPTNEDILSALNKIINENKI